MRRAGEKRPQRINRIARKWARRAEKQGRGGIKKPLLRVERNPRVRPLIAYDLETTRIAAGNPRVLYLTAYSDIFTHSGPLTGLEQLAEILRSRFLVPELNRARFVAWNANNFDVYFIALSLLAHPEFQLRPYLTRSKNLRGLRVERARLPSEIDKRSRSKKLTWEFLDGIAMTGAQGVKLKKFVEGFAPDFPKLEGPDFEAGEEFSAANPAHVRYAERDSEGLYRALIRAQSITLEHFNIPLQPTIGNLGIKIFQSRMPASAVVWAPPFEVTDIIRRNVMRGGFTFCVRRYQGPVWKFDINQAYAAAMRETDLPGGRCVACGPKLNPYASTFIVKVRGALAPGNLIPFYYRDAEGVAHWARDEISDTWITSTEFSQLNAEGARLQTLDSYFWDETFRMTDYVNALEALRTKGADGKDDAQGQMMKYIGNNSYGKTVEQLDGLDIVMACERPEGYSHFQADDPKLECLWFKMETPQFRDYHRPQIGAFITAYIRMVVRRAALRAPAEWLYADTDCVMFSRPVALDCDARRYGAWKIEETGAQHLLIADKVYYNIDKEKGHAKGLNVARLTREAFEKWFAGLPPEQTQVQRANFVKAMLGQPMFYERKRVGEKT